MMHLIILIEYFTKQPISYKICNIILFIRKNQNNFSTLIIIINLTNDYHKDKITFEREKASCTFLKRFIGVLPPRQISQVKKPLEKASV